jgi:sortase A
VPSSCAESVANITPSSPKHRNAASTGAAFALGVGVFLIVFSYSLYIGGTPTQDSPISLPIQTITPAPIETPFAAYPVKPKQGEKIGTITLPSLGLSWPVYEGTGDSQLAKGVGHYVGSVLPGVKDNTVLSGHRMTVFNRLGELSKNDDVYVRTSAGLFVYQVLSFRVVNRTDRTVIVPDSAAILTLTTCWPFNHEGKTYQAFIVRARLVESFLN